MNTKCLSIMLAATAVLAGTIATATTASAAGQASAFPDRPIRIVVPYPPGGSTDMLARLVGKEVSDVLGQPVIVENRAGASGSIGAAHVASSPADGYTLLLGAGTTLAVNPHLYNNLSYKPLQDFAPVILATYLPAVVVVHPSLNVHSMKELEGYLKSNSGKVNYASGGNGTPSHLGVELYKRMLGVNITNVPYKGGASALTDLVGGQTQLMFPYIAEALPLINSGKIRAIAVTTRTRSKILPALPTVEESGVAGFDLSGWYGFVVPAGVPADIIEKLNTAFNTALDKPEVRKQLESAAMDVVGGSPSVFGQLIKTEYDKWGKVIKEAGIVSN